MCKWFSLVLLLLVSAGLGAGCGEEARSVAQQPVSALLIDEAELPRGARALRGTSAAPCDPLEVLKQPGSEAAKSAMFVMGEVRAQEAVGVFTAKPAALAALDALDAPSRFDCVKETIEIQDQSVTVGASRDLDLGDEARARRLLARSGETGRVSSIDIVSFRLGRAVASMIFVSPSPKTPVVVADTVDAAAGLLAARGGEP